MKTTSINFVRKILLLTLSVLCIVPVALASTGTLVITADTTLTEDHQGNILISANKVTLDCARHTVSGPGVPGFNGGIEVAGGLNGVTVRHCRVTGFDVNGLFGGGEDGRYEANVFYGNGNHGMHLAVTSGNVIVGNTSRRNGGIGIVLTQASNNWIAQNVVEDNHNWAGIGLLDQSHDNGVVGNTARRNSIGIVLDGAVKNQIKLNTSSANDTAGVLLIRAANQNIVEFNVANRNKTGIQVTEGSDANQMRDNEANLNSGEGFTIYQSNHNSLSRNVANKNGDYGFLVFGGSSFNTLTGNAGRGNGLFDGYDEDTGTGDVWKNNRFGKTSGF